MRGRRLSIVPAPERLIDMRSVSIGVAVHRAAFSTVAVWR